MSDRLKQLTDDLKKTHLTVDEKDAVRNELLQFMKAHPATLKSPAKVTSPAAEQERERSNPFASFFTFLIPRPMPVLAALLVVVVGGGSVSLAAQNALPGDALYSVKVGVNEEVVSLFRFDDTAKLEWEIERSERRLTEANTLESQGALDKAALTRLSDRLEFHNARIEVLESNLGVRGNNDPSLVVLQDAYEAKLTLYEDLLYTILAEGRPVAFTTEASTSTTVTAGDTTTSGVVTSVTAVDTAVLVELPAFNVSGEEDKEETTLSDLIREYRTEGSSNASESAATSTGTTEPPAPPRFLKEAKGAMESAYSRFTEASLYVDRIGGKIGYDNVAESLELLEKARALYNAGNRLFQASTYHEAYANFNRSFDLSKQARESADQALAEFERNDTPVTPVVTPPPPAPAPVEPKPAKPVSPAPASAPTPAPASAPTPAPASAPTPAPASAPTPAPAPAPAPAIDPVSTQEAWASRAKEQRNLTENTFSTTEARVHIYMDEWGAKAFSDVIVLFDQAITLMAEGRAAYDKGLYQDAYESYANAHSVTLKASVSAEDVLRRLKAEAAASVRSSVPVEAPAIEVEPVPVKEPAVEVKPVPVKEPVVEVEVETTSSFKEKVTTSKESAFELFTRVSLSVNKLASSLGYDRMSEPLRLLEDARRLYNDGNRLFVEGNFEAAYENFEKVYALCKEADALAGRLR